MTDTKQQLDSYVEESKSVIDAYINSKCNQFFDGLQERLVRLINTHLEAYNDLVKDQAEEIKLLKEENFLMKNEVLKMKKANLEQGVHDRKRDIIISGLEEDAGETPQSLEVKIRANLVSTLDIPKAEVDKFVFTARHRLHKPKSGNAKVIAVLTDLDHVQRVISAARRKGKDGQHLQNHLPQELQKWRNRCLWERKQLIDDGAEKKDLRLRDFKGFTKLQQKNGADWDTLLEYKVTFDDSVNFPKDFIESQRQF